MKKNKEKLLPKLEDVENTLDNLNYKISDICIEYYNKGYNKAKEEMGVK